MKLYKIITLAIVCLMALPLSAEKEEYSVNSTTFYVLVNESPNFVSEIRKYCNQESGYTKYFSDQQIILRIPTKSLPGLQDLISKMGYISDEQISTADLGGELVDLQSRLKTKEKLLSELNLLFSASEFRQTLEVEKEIDEVIREIEALKGKIRYDKDLISFSTVSIQMNFNNVIDKKKPAPRTGFDWIRNLGVINLMENY